MAYDSFTAMFDNEAYRLEKIIIKLNAVDLHT